MARITDQSIKDMAWIIESMLPASGTIKMKKYPSMIALEGPRVDLEKLSNRVREYRAEYDVRGIIGLFEEELKTNQLYYTKK